MKARLALLFVVLWFVLPARAQFYAPDTEYHDICQRTVPVEAARVLAWLRNAGGAEIATVDYKVETTAQRETVWAVTWRNAAGQPLRERTVRYEETLLTTGADWFRSVFAQLCGEDWKLAATGAADVDAAFWHGAELAGVSRMEGVAAAGRLLVKQPRIETAADAARLAGVLAHAALPILSTLQTLDSVLLSRAAAWLGISEALRGEKGEAAWCPLLFLSGRERLARKLWQASHAEADAKMLPAEHFWDFLLRNPKPPEVFVFAARRENRPFAMPLLARFGHLVNDYIDAVCEVADPIFGEMLPRLCDYGPQLTEFGEVAGGRLVEGVWPTLARRAWLKALSAHQPTVHDFTGYRGALREVKLEAGDQTADDESLAALGEAVPLINAGYEEGVGPLIPVAHATARDLLNFGWENQALQLGIRHHFVKDMWGVPELAQKIIEAARELKGVDPFFTEPGDSLRSPLPDPLRLQFIGNRGLSKQLAAKPWSAADDHRATYLRRCWLWRVSVDRQLGALARGRLSSAECRELMGRIEQEGGAATDARTIVAIVYYLGQRTMQMPDIREFEAKLVAQTPTPVTYAQRAVWRGIAEATRPSSASRERKRSKGFAGKATSATNSPFRPRHISRRTRSSRSSGSMARAAHSARMASSSATK